MFTLLRIGTGPPQNLVSAGGEETLPSLFEIGAFAIWHQRQDWYR